MELVGRLTGDAKVSTVKDDRKVVNFSIAINDSYKAKGSEKVTKITTFINCSYWRNFGIAEYLTKGALVEVFGRISANDAATQDQYIRRRHTWYAAEQDAAPHLRFF